MLAFRGVYQRFNCLLGIILLVSWIPSWDTKAFSIRNLSNHPANLMELETRTLHEDLSLAPRQGHFHWFSCGFHAKKMYESSLDLARFAQIWGKLTWEMDHAHVEVTLLHVYQTINTNERFTDGCLQCQTSTSGHDCWRFPLPSWNLWLSKCHS